MGAEAASAAASPPRTPGAGARPGAAAPGDFSPAPVGGDFGGLLPWGAPPPLAGEGGGGGGPGEPHAALAQALTSGLGAAGEWVLGAAAGGPQQPPPQSPGAVGRSVQHIVRQHAEAVATTRARCQELETEAQTLRERVSARGSQLSDLRDEVGGLRAKLQHAGVSPLRASPWPPRPAAEVLSPDGPGKGLEGAFAGAAASVEGGDAGLWRTAAEALEVELRGGREEAAALLRECEVLREAAAPRTKGGGSAGAAVGQRADPPAAAAQAPPEREDDGRAAGEWERRALEAEAAVAAAAADAAAAKDLARETAERDEWEARVGDLLREVEELRPAVGCPPPGAPEEERESERKRWESRAVEFEAASKAAAEAAAEDLARVTAERDEWEARAGDLLTDLETLQATAELGGGASKDLARLTAERDEWRTRASDLLTDLEAQHSAGSDVARETVEQERRAAEAEAAA